MIVRHQRNVAAFVGAHTTWFLPGQIVEGFVSVTSAAPTNVTISQARSVGRFIFARVFGRVN